MKASAKGTISKIRVLKLAPQTLVRFTLKAEHQTYNCIVSRKNIVDQVLMLPEETKNISVYGHFNKRNQLVIEKLAGNPFANSHEIEYFRKRA
ncbi:hypothetical protein P7H60_13620 [Vagococcus carniphilus]|uniref:hypothetical protein n=1 Tax=Vagococcus carniphilus TaxID=218144 RepID=UPI00288D0338|nr:hypothetical protein [Vagococcus carniphilus]MDT2850188.1 hypothetical protein [Vagococcus carniphilus]